MLRGEKDLKNTTPRKTFIPLIDLSKWKFRATFEFFFLSCFNSVKLMMSDKFPEQFSNSVSNAISSGTISCSNSSTTDSRRSAKNSFRRIP
jgi:hypothetical protein